MKGKVQRASHINDDKKDDEVRNSWARFREGMGMIRHDDRCQGVGIGMPNGRLQGRGDRSRFRLTLLDDCATLPLTFHQHMVVKMVAIISLSRNYMNTSSAYFLVGAGLAGKTIW